MWPGRVPTASRISTTMRSSSSSGANSATGSMLPWMPNLRIDLLDGLLHVEAPVDADDVAAGLLGQVEHRGRAVREVDDRHAAIRNDLVAVRLDLVDDALGVLQHGALVVARSDVADPAVEELHGLRAGVDLRLEVGDGGVGELGQQQVPRLGLAPHERLAVLVVARAVALDRVARERERRAGEADERHLVLELAAQDLDRSPCT